LALAYLSQAKFSQAETLAREAFEFFRKRPQDDWDWDVYRAESLLGASLAGQKQFSDAEPILLEGYRGMASRKERIGVPDRYHMDQAREWIGQLYRAWGRPANASEWEKQ